MSAYAALEERFRKLDALDRTLALLEWDRSVMMPKGAGETRAEQTATLAVMSHELLSDPETAAWIDQAKSENLGDWQQANLREIERIHRQKVALPSDLVAALAKAAQRSELAWRDARAEADFVTFSPLLAEVIRLVREEAAIKGEALRLGAYDALLASFQPGVDQRAIDRLFEPLADRLPDLLERVLTSQKKPLVPHGPFAVDRQRDLAQRLMAQIGFDFDRGRLDESTHPFCGGVPGDIRITTRYDEADLISGIMGVVHETGHALYEAGRPEAWMAQPVGEARGMAAHESQSLIIEMQACRSEPFLTFLSGQLIERFGEQPAFMGDNLRHLTTFVSRGLIRVDADEVTYPLHILLRYRLEKALISGNLEVADLPGAWNDGLFELLGVRPDNDRVGVLQDIHWPLGLFGYFPSYTLGALLAAQLFQAAVKTAPTIPSDLGRGDFRGLLAWLRENVHGHGSRLSFDELVIAATGQRLSADPFLSHLEKRYLTRG
ncbi:MAG: carboxypeptidase M32 [Geminicoccaceae bacterium]